MNSTSYSMNVIPAWNKGYTGKNVIVSIIDDGVEHRHPDLRDSYVRIYLLEFV